MATCRWNKRVSKFTYRSLSIQVTDLHFQLQVPGVLRFPGHQEGNYRQGDCGD